MKSLKTIIVDDEPLALSLMTSILGDIPQIELVAQCGGGREAVKKIRELQPDLVILDIQMPKVDGFDVVKQVQADAMPMVIFATAFDQYAADAFDLHAVDYVLKPFVPERVAKSVERALLRFNTLDAGDRKTPLIGAIGDIANRGIEVGEDETSHQQEQQSRKLAVRDGGVVTLIPFEQIEWVDAAGDYMCIHVGGETHIMRSTMKELEAKLAGDQFARVHRSTLVNLDKIESIQMLPKGECLLNLGGDNTLKVSRNYRQSVQHLLQ